MRVLTILGLCAACAMGQTATREPKVIDGQRVLPGPKFVAEPLVELRGLSFYDCTLEEKGRQCTVATGTLVSHLQHDKFVISVEIEMFEVFKDHTYSGSKGTIHFTVERPRPGVPEKFTALGPEWRSGKADAMAYTVAFKIGMFKP